MELMEPIKGKELDEVPIMMVDLFKVNMELDVVTVVVNNVSDMPGLGLLLKHDDYCVVKARRRNWQGNWHHLEQFVTLMDLQWQQC
jgi:hypothetical protein